MRFQNKVAIVTGGARGIGASIAQAFREEGARVYTIDLVPPADLIGDLGRQEDLEALTATILEQETGIDYLIHNAPPLMKGLDSASYQDFSQALQVGVTAPFYLTKLLTNRLNPGASIVMMSSSRARMSQAQTETYSAAKGGLAALTHALAISLSGKARVNSISPGWIDTSDQAWGAPDHQQHPVGRIGQSTDVANLVLFLCSDQASFITGEDITIDGGMSRLMIYNDDQGWTYRPDSH